MKVFSFCLYGKYQDKYYLGLVENLKIIKDNYSDFNTFVYLGDDVDEKAAQKIKEEFREVKFIRTGCSGAQNTTHRFIGPLKDEKVEIFFTRDSDSRINGRDRWCVDKFLSTNCFAHTIRDNFWHKFSLMGGTSGFDMVKLRSYWSENSVNISSLLKAFESKKDWKYGDDEKFVKSQIYPLIPRDKVLVHTDICPYENENWEKIGFERTDTNFVGNVVEYKDNQEFYQFNYWDFDWLKQLRWLKGQSHFQVAVDLFGDKIDQFILKEKELRGRQFLSSLFGCYHYIEDIVGCQNILKYYQYCFIDNRMKKHSTYLYTLMKRKGWSIVGSTFLGYQPEEKEIVVYYGNFPDDYNCLPHSKKVYLNSVYYGKIKHTKFIYDPLWDNIDKIYVMGLESRSDRKAEVLGELCKMSAPLNKVYYYAAKKNPNITGYAGATENHMNCMKDMIDKKYQQCLFLEDDFVFNSTIDRNKCILKEFFEKKYDYHMVFLSASKMHKRIPFDNLMVKSLQECTTCSGYFLNSKKVKDIYDNVSEAYQHLLQNKNPNVYCVDRYWYKLMEENNFLIFKDKLGYQRPSYSNLKNQVVMFLD